MKKRIVFILVLAVLIVSFSNVTLGQSGDLEFLVDVADSTTKREIFATLKSVEVLVSFKEAPLLDRNLEKKVLFDIEKKLRQSGFVIANGTNSFLFITVKSVYSEGNITSFLIEATLREKFLLARDKSIEREEAVWIRQREIRADKASEVTIQAGILTLVDKFVDICANAKKKSDTKY